jgi:hypothetical protein
MQFIRGTAEIARKLRCRRGFSLNFKLLKRSDGSLAAGSSGDIGRRVGNGCNGSVRGVAIATVGRTVKTGAVFPIRKV